MKKLLACLLAVCLLCPPALSAQSRKPSLPYPTEEEKMFLLVYPCDDAKASSLNLHVQGALYRQDAALYKELADIQNAFFIKRLARCPQKDDWFDPLAQNLQAGVMKATDMLALLTAAKEVIAAAPQCRRDACTRPALAAALLTLAGSAIQPESPFGFSVEEQGRLSRAAAEAAQTIETVLPQDLGGIQTKTFMLRPFLSALYVWRGYETLAAAVRGIIAQSEQKAWGNYARNVYDTKRYPLEEAAMEVLSSTAEQAKNDLLEYALKGYTKTSAVRASIALSYLSLSPFLTKVIEDNVKNYYCQGLTKDPALDKRLKTELAFAYGHGRSLQYITPTGDKCCLVTVPQGEDPRLVNAKQVRQFMGFLGESLLWYTGFEVVSFGARALRINRVLKGAGQMRKAALQMPQPAALYRSGQTAQKVERALAAASPVKTTGSVADDILRAKPISSSGFGNRIVLKKGSPMTESIKDELEQLGGKRLYQQVEKSLGLGDDLTSSYVKKGSKKLAKKHKKKAVVRTSSVAETASSAAAPALRQEAQLLSQNSETLLHYLRDTYGLELTRLRSVRTLLDRAETLGDAGALKEAVFTRIENLLANKQEIIKSYSRAAGTFSSRPNIRLRYLGNEQTVTAQTFQPKLMTLVLEEHIQPGNLLMKNHLSQMVQRINGPSFPFRLDTKGVASIMVLPKARTRDISRLYRELLNCSAQSPCRFVLDHGETLMLYAPDEQIWLRVGKHEVANKFHLHLNTKTTLRLKEGPFKGQETVILNYPVSVTGAEKVFRSTAKLKGREAYVAAQRAVVAEENYRLFVTQALEDLVRAGVAVPY